MLTLRLKQLTKESAKEWLEAGGYSPNDDNADWEAFMIALPGTWQPSEPLYNTYENLMETLCKHWRIELKGETFQMGFIVLGRLFMNTVPGFSMHDTDSDEVTYHVAADAYEYASS